MPDPSGYGFFCTLAELQPTQVSGLNEIVCGVVNPFVDGSGLRVLRQLVKTSLDISVNEP